MDVEEEKEVPPEAAKEDAKAPEPQPDPPVPGMLGSSRPYVILCFMMPAIQACVFHQLFGDFGENLPISCCLFMACPARH